jgi:tRNA(Arg) A34 adenosine deaminase TadA
LSKIFHEPNEKFMEIAIKWGRKNIKKMDGGPFGACIVKNNKVIAASKNNVLKSNATAHAEVLAIQKASKKLNTYFLKDCIIYSTTEPCPMCFSAIHWAGIEQIVFGTNINDVAKIGFNEMMISNKKLKSLAKINTTITKGFLYSKCKKLLDDWNAVSNHCVY